MNHKRRLRIAKPASEELADAVRWYEAQRPGLGGDLYDAVNGTIESITRQPELGSTDYADRLSRRVLISRFPYHVVYRLEADAIIILAIAHMKRRPGYWKHRT